MDTERLVGCRLEKIKGWCCEVRYGSREPSPGNQEITFLSLCVHVLAVVCELSFQARFEDNVFQHSKASHSSSNTQNYMLAVSYAPPPTPTPTPTMFSLSPFHLHCVSAGRVSLVRITALRLEGLQLDDHGLYECRILLLDKPTDELRNGTWTLLSVTGEVYGIVCVPVYVCFMSLWLSVK